MKLELQSLLELFGVQPTGNKYDFFIKIALWVGGTGLLLGFIGMLLGTLALVRGPATSDITTALEATTELSTKLEKLDSDYKVAMARIAVLEQDNVNLIVAANTFTQAITVLQGASAVANTPEEGSPSTTSTTLAPPADTPTKPSGGSKLIIEGKNGVLTNQQCQGLDLSSPTLDKAIQACMESAAMPIPEQAPEGGTAGSSGRPIKELERGLLANIKNPGKAFRHH